MVLPVNFMMSERRIRLSLAVDSVFNYDDESRTGQFDSDGNW